MLLVMDLNFARNFDGILDLARRDVSNMRLMHSSVRTYVCNIRAYSTNLAGYQSLVYNARENVSRLLERQDRSSYLLSQYVPEPARDAFLAIRAFNLEINKIDDRGSAQASQASDYMSQTVGVSPADMKFKFWSDLLSQIFMSPNSEKHVGEPIAILLRDALRNDLNLDISYFHKFLQTRRLFLKSKSFKTVEDICSYGEGTYSQLNYLSQGLLLSPSISPSTILLLEHSEQLQTLASDVAAHIGQATSVSSMILGLPYYASKRNQVTLPIDLMTKFDISQEDVIRVFQGHLKDDSKLPDVRDKMKNVIFETAITANDHILTARQKISQMQNAIPDIVKANPKDALLQKYSRKWRRNIPDVLFIPFMTGIPSALYLQKLEKYDFDILNSKVSQKEWRLAYKSFMSYYTRTI